MKNVNRLALLSLVVYSTNTGFSQLNNHHKNYIDIGIVGGMQHHNSPLGGVYASIGTFFIAFGRPSLIDIRVKEL